MELIKLVSESLGLTSDRVLGRGQTKHLLYSRYIVVAVLREEGHSTNEIADLFILYNRNTIANHFKTAFDDLLSYNKEFKCMYLKAVKAVEDFENESKNESPAA